VPDSRESSTPPRGDDADALAALDPRERGEWWWRQPKWSRREWRLEAGSRTVAFLKGESLFSSTAHVRFADAAFDVHRGWTGNFEVRPEGSPESLARFVSRWSGGGRLESAAGDPLEVVSKGFFTKTIELRTPEEHVLMRYESHDSLTRHEVQVIAEDPARKRDDLRALIALSGAILFAPKRHSY
jgi:hypothetical protein